MSHGAHCAACMRLRIFLTMAGALICAIYLQPVWAATLARFMPSPLMIGIGICIAAGVTFGVRLHRYRRRAG